MRPDEVDTEPPDAPDAGPLPQPMFPHPPWTVGVVLVLAIPMLILGVFGHPIWFFIGVPFIAPFVVWLAVRIAQRTRRIASRVDADGPDSA